MKPIGLALALAAFLAPLAQPASGGTAIASACLQSGRGAGAAQLCGCIQNVADAVLSPAEQKRGAQIILDPHMSQEIRASARRSDEAFWQKWEVFGASAAEYCQ